MTSGSGGGSSSSSGGSGKITIPSLEGVVPLTDITDPKDVDVLCGRSGSSQRHVGTQQFRTLVNLNKGLYVTCLKSEKLRISRSIVAAIREQRGRFLEKDGDKGKWYDIGDKKAIEKTSQALRENQPKLRKKIMENGLPPSVMPSTGQSSSSSSNTNNNPSQIPVNRSTQALRSQQAMMERSMSATAATAAAANGGVGATSNMGTPQSQMNRGTSATGGSGSSSNNNNRIPSYGMDGVSGMQNPGASMHHRQQQQQQQQQYHMLQQRQQQQQQMMERAYMYDNQMMAQQQQQQQRQPQHLRQQQQRQDLSGIPPIGVGSGGGGGLEDMNEILMLQRQLSISSSQNIPQGNGMGLMGQNPRNSFMSNTSDGTPIPYHPSQQQQQQQQQMYQRTSLGPVDFDTSHGQMGSSTMPMGHRDRLISQRTNSMSQPTRKNHTEQNLNDSDGTLHTSNSRTNDNRHQDHAEHSSPVRNMNNGLGRPPIGAGFSSSPGDGDKNGSPTTTTSMGLSAAGSIGSDIFSASNSHSTPPLPFAPSDIAGGRASSSGSGIPTGYNFPPTGYQNQQNNINNHNTNNNISNNNRVDRRRLFARMKVSHPASGRMTDGASYCSGRSNGANDWVPDINMVDSQFSLLSGLSGTKSRGGGGTVGDNMTVMSGTGSAGRYSNYNANTMGSSAVSKGGASDDYMDVATIGSRRSLMSGLPRIDDGSDVQSIFSDLSRKIGNVSTRSIAMSEFSGFEDGSRLTATDTFSMAS